MLYIRVCYDKPGMGELRDRLRNNHRAYFKPNLAGGDAAVRLVQAGPLCTSDTDTTNIGSFMILEAKSHADVMEFNDGDPFTAAKLYERVEIHRWDRHVTDGKFHG